MPEDVKDGHSSGEYSGVVEDADVAVKGNAQDMAAVISSGQRARERRQRKKENKEKEGEDEKKNEGDR
ncbi:8a29936b-cb02-4de0-b6d1-921f402c2765 [Thermothielavioides terrestris]|uniref:8a29936b-cb02-4de0-b6d1-921f402c2765 n=1 Tax=Thermothielavioides terrestris TaxID=2587410 RepID=A0A446BHY7_9PEZI|nr:8a29936b-cb02-4de0-b6d1-921f402c2765 [Thermothielavioides terrestris]